MSWNYKTSKVGDQIPSLEIDPLKQSDLILYANATADHTISLLLILYKNIVLANQSTS